MAMAVKDLSLVNGHWTCGQNKDNSDYKWINEVVEKLFKFPVQEKGVFLEIGFKKVQTYKSTAKIQPSVLWRKWNSYNAIPLQSFNDLNMHRAVIRCENQIAPQIIVLFSKKIVKVGKWDSRREREGTAEAEWM